MKHFTTYVRKCISYNRTQLNTTEHHSIPQNTTTLKIYNYKNSKLIFAKKLNPHMKDGNCQLVIGLNIKYLFLDRLNNFIYNLFFVIT